MGREKKARWIKIKTHQNPQINLKLNFHGPVKMSGPTTAAHFTLDFPRNLLAGRGTWPAIPVMLPTAIKHFDRAASKCFLRFSLI